MESPHRRPPRILGLLAIVTLGPVGVVLAALAAGYLAHQFISGWIPADWWSGSFADWMIGFGQKGSASDYVGFMITAVPAGLCFNGVKWGLGVLSDH